MLTHLIDRDIQHSQPEEDRAFINMYQSLGYLKHGILNVLQPRRQVAACVIDETLNAKPVPTSRKLLQEAIACYQDISEQDRKNNYRSLH